MDNVEKLDVMDAFRLYDAQANEKFLSAAASDTFASKAELAAVSFSSNTTVARAVSDGSGNIIPGTYATKTALSTGLNSKLDSDATAAAAFKDSSGNVITDTYATKTALSTGLNSKLDSDATAAAAFKDSSGNVITDTYATKTELANIQFSHSFSPAIVVSANNAQLLTVSDGSVTLTASFSNHSATVIIPSFGSWSVTVSKNDVSRSVSINVDTVKIYELSIDVPVRYGYRISKTETDPDERVEYLYDAVGMSPAHMDFETGQFDYGSWADVWFVKDNKPLMLKYDGTVDYYLNPNNYAQRENGSSSDIANTYYGGNAMAQFPLVWVYRYEDEDYYYEIISNEQWDSNYKAYAHTNSSGVVKDYFYWGIYYTFCDNKFRSLSNLPLTKTFSDPVTASTIYNYCTANGSNWYPISWAQCSLIGTLARLMAKSVNLRNAFGQRNNTALTTSGLTNTRGQFFGTSDKSAEIKFMHVEGMWTLTKTSLLAGFLSANNRFFAKMTPPYSVTSTSGYTDVGSDFNNDTTITAWADYFATAVQCNEYGLIHTQISSSIEGSLQIKYQSAKDTFKVPVTISEPPSSMMLCVGNNMVSTITGRLAYV